MSLGSFRLADADRPAELRQAFACFPSGVTAVCALVDGRPTGLAASSFVSVSLRPPLASFCVSHDSTTWPVLRAAPRLGISVLSEHHEQSCRALAARIDDRFAGLDWSSLEDGAVFVGGVPLQLDCSVEMAVPAGDHDIVVLQVVRFRTNPHIAPLLFHRSSFHRLAQQTEHVP
jgi:flavin reductase (DIM6/NTAB) family NADH-FMN oxidoreductase RutF